MKFIITMFISALLSQDINIDTSTEADGTTGSIGTVTINGQIYNQISLRPEIPIGNMGIGLDLYLYFNDDGMYWESWDFTSGAATYRTIIDKIYYLRWGHPGDNLYILGGALPSTTLGQGILVNNYSNIIEYPQVRQIGINLQAKVADVGIELIHSNFKVASPGIIGLRGSYNIFGISFVTDLDQNGGLKDGDGDSYPDYYDFYPNDIEKWDDENEAQDEWDSFNEFLVNQGGEPLDNSLFNDWFEDSQYYNDYNPDEAAKDPISGISFDVVYPLSKKIIIYSQIAQLIGEIDTSLSHLNHLNLEETKLGWGSVPIGLKAKLGPVNLLAEYRMNSRRFIFNYWDRAYDVNRVILNSSGIPTTRESQLYQYGKLKGIYAQAEMSVMNLANLGIGYQNMQGETWDEETEGYRTSESNQTFLTTISIKPLLIPKIGKAEAFYQQSNIPNPFDFTPNTSTIWGFNVGVEVSSGVMLIYQARTTYISDLDNPGEFQAVNSVQIETQFVF